jgi:hypothetical protein
VVEGHSITRFTRRSGFAGPNVAEGGGSCFHPWGRFTRFRWDGAAGPFLAKSGILVRSFCPYSYRVAAAFAQIGL